MSFATVQTTQSNWLFITPISNLEILKEIGGEYSVERVTFFNAKKLIRVHKRLGVREPFSKINKRLTGKFFKLSDTYAVIRCSGRPKEIKLDCLRMIDEELAILAVSQLVFMKRDYFAKYGVYGQYSNSITETLFLSTKSKVGTRETEFVDDPIPFSLDQLWHNFHKKLFFHALIKIFNKKIQVANSWRIDLRRAAVLIGKGILSYDIPTAFLNNMIALEILLTNQGDSYVKVLPDRIEAFLGWAGYWSTNRFREKIERIYRMRCGLVHDGNYESITKEALIFSDELIINLFMNLCRYPKLFQSKNDIVNFSEKVKAEKLLGMKRKVRPKKLTLISSNYSTASLLKM